MDKKIANTCVSAVDDGTMSNYWGSINIDDEGMLSNMNYFFRYTNNDYYVEPILIAGKALAVGTNEEGEVVLTCKKNLYRIKKEPPSNL